MSMPSAHRDLDATGASPDRRGFSRPGLRPAQTIDTTVPHSARIWNYWLGGKDHYPVDREAGDTYRELYPGIVNTARAVRYFMARAVRALAAEQGVRQFLDVGTGLPAVDNTHEVAQRVAPDARIVYVDNDPLVLAHARALLTSSRAGACGYVDADMREPGKIISAAAQTLDFDEPVALMFLGVLGHIGDDRQAQAIVGDLMAALAPGSYLVLADSISVGRAHIAAEQNYATTGAVPYRLRSPGQIERFVGDLQLLPRDWSPWRPGGQTRPRCRRSTSTPWAAWPASKVVRRGHEPGRGLPPMAVARLSCCRRPGCNSHLIERMIAE